jgi:ribosomal protein S18 acetylase RimI-like enzyme
MTSSFDLHPTIDREWLEQAAEREPIEHAYTLWDLDRYADRVRIVSAMRDGRTVGYLLVWAGLPGTSIVQWHAGEPGLERLADALPARPLVAIVPPEARAAVLAVRGPAREFPERMMLRPREPLVRGPGAASSVRPLRSADRAELWAWARSQPDPQTAEYPGLDPAVDAIWGAYDRGRLVGAARAAVQLPREWIVAGVYVEPGVRRRGFGAALVASIVTTALDRGARTGLYVRDDRPEAWRLYERLGFRTIARRWWLDLGADLAP